MRPGDVARHAFPVIVCAFLNGAAYLQAKGIDALVSGALLRDTPIGAPARSNIDFPRPTSRPNHVTSADPVLDRNPFDSLTGPLVEARHRFSSPRAPGPSCDGVKASLVAVGDDPTWSFASLAAPGAPPLLRRIGDDVAGRTVLAIRRDRVLLGAGDAVCEVKLGKVTPASPAASEATSSAIARVADDQLVVHRSELAALVQSPTALLGRVRVHPVDGGLRVAGVREGSPLAALGLQNGDVLKSVNGTPLADPAASVAALAGLLHSDHVDVVLEHAGAEKVLRVEIRD